ncbi:MAG: hypothetical protein R3F19_03130 [Verrucomicrobiales bacterium]
MEGLISVIFGFIGIAIAGVFAALVSLIGVTMQLILGILASLKSDRLSRDHEGSNRASVRLPAWMRRGLRVACFLCVGLLGVLVCLNSFFFDPVVERAARFVLAKRGIEFQHSRLDGNFFTGRLEIEGLKADSGAWAMEVDIVRVDIALTSLFSNPIRIESLEVEGFTGKATMDRPVPKAEHVSSGDTPEKRERRNLVIDQLDLKEAAMQMTYSDGELPPIHSVKIDSLTSEKFRSRWAIFYLFFRSNLQGELNGKPFVVSVTDRAPVGKTTRWKIEDLPLKPLATPGGAFDWFDAGEVTIDVQDDWVQSDHLEVDLAWQLVFTNIKATAPEGSIVRKAVVDYLNAGTDPLEVAFRLKLDPETFEGSSSAAANALYQNVADAVVKSAADRLSIKRESIEKAKDGVIDGVRSLLDKARMKED